VKEIDLQFVKDALSELDPSLNDSEETEAYRTALVVVAALVEGPDTVRLAEFTEMPWDFVETIRRRMIQAELWNEIDIFCDHWFVEGGIVRPTALWLDVLIAQGLLVRSWDEEAADYRYFDANYPQADRG